MSLHDLEFVIFYAGVILFVLYIGGLSGYQILKSDQIGTFTPEFNLNPISAIQTFFAVMTSATPASATYSTLFTLIFTPFLIGILFLTIKWLRGTS